MAAPAKPVARNVGGLNARFMQVIERLGHTGYSICKVLDTSEPVISNIRNGKHPPNIKLVQLLLEKHEEVNADWLMTGKGMMFRGIQVTVSRTSPKGTDTDDSVVPRLKAIESLLKRTMHLQMERDLLVDESISGLEKQMSTVRKKLDLVTKERHSAK